MGHVCAKIFVMVLRGWLEEAVGFVRGRVLLDAKRLISIGYSELHARLEGTVTLAGTTKAIGPGDLAQLCQLWLSRFHKEPRAHWLAGSGGDPATVAGDEHRTAERLRSGEGV